MNLNRIASELGYYDPSHLSREFKNIAGMKAIDFVRSEDFISRCLIAETNQQHNLRGTSINPVHGKKNFLRKSIQ